MTCRICKAQEFYLNGACVPCLDCLECDSLGCTQCGFYTYLVNRTCVCYNDSLVNVEGYCKCPVGSYEVMSVNWDTICYSCPPSCYTCSGNATDAHCLACKEGSHRHSPNDGCVCEEGYFEISNTRAYCCHITCLECNETGCT